MNTTLIVMLGVAAVAVVLAATRRPKMTEPESGDDPIVSGDFELVPESVSEARARRAMPKAASEDARALLVPPSLASEVGDHDDNYPPDRAVDWVVDVAFPLGTVLSGRQVQGFVDQEFLRSIDGAMIHGLCSTTGKWTYVGAGGAPEPYSRIALAKSLTRSTEAGDEPLDAGSLRHMFNSVRDLFTSLGGTVVSTDESPEQAAARSERLVQLKRHCGQEVAVMLRAPRGKQFDGRHIWDLMLSLGLHWGDMDLFHWGNPTESGHDTFCSWSRAAVRAPPTPSHPRSQSQSQPDSQRRLQGRGECGNGPAGTALRLLPGLTRTGREGRAGQGHSGQEDRLGHSAAVEERRALGSRETDDAGDIASGFECDC